MNDISIVEYNKEDKNSCIDLLKKTFVGSSDEQTFNWRFESLLRQTPLMVCAKDHDKVVSFISWIPWEFTYNGERLVGYQGGELATDVEYRRQGIASRVLEYGNTLAQDRNIDFLYTFTHSMRYYSNRAQYKTGYTPIGNYYNYVRLINPLKKRTKGKIDNQYSDIIHPLIVEKNKVTPIFNSGYFKWRYLDNPKSYDVICYYENNNQAIFILRKRKHYISSFKVKINVMILLDCQFTCYNDLFIKNAIKYLDQVYSGKALFMTTFFNENTDRGKILIKHFKIKNQSKFKILCIKPINKSMDQSIFFNINNWDILPHVKDDN